MADASLLGDFYEGRAVNNRMIVGRWSAKRLLKPRAAWLFLAAFAATFSIGVGWLWLRCERQMDQFYLCRRVNYKISNDKDVVWVHAGIDAAPPWPIPPSADKSTIPSGFSHSVWAPQVAGDILTDQVIKGILFRFQRGTFGFACWTPTAYTPYNDFGLYILAPHRWLLMFGLVACFLCLRIYSRLERRERNRIAAGICIRCGYDLRGSPDRCPECGSAPPTPGRGTRMNEPRTEASDGENPELVSGG